MESVCLFAVFTESLGNDPNGLNLFGVRANFISDPRQREGGITTKLVVGVHAEVGKHELSVHWEEFKLQEYPAFASISVEIGLNEGNTKIVFMSGQFPVHLSDKINVNRYSLLLDGLPFGNAYLVAEPI